MKIPRFPEMRYPFRAAPHNSARRRLSSKTQLCGVALALNSIKNAETQGQYSVPEKNHQLHDPGKVRESCNRWLWQTDTSSL